MNNSIFGLPNLGNTCYLNSAVQLLCLNPQFQSIENISNNPSKAIKKIKQKLTTISSRFSGNTQEDSGEALLLLLDYYANKIGILTQYQFTEKTRIRCKLLMCLHEEISIRKSDVLLLDINDSKTLDDCYRNFKNATRLFGENAWLCSNCNQKTISSKRFFINEWSNFLIIGLKRFYYRGTRYIKNNNSIAVPLKWRHGYRLKGAIIHSGSLHGGHYICVGEKNDKWYMFNDSSVHEIPNQKVLLNHLSNSYFLLFQKI